MCFDQSGVTKNDLNQRMSLAFPAFISSSPQYQSLTYTIAYHGIVMKNFNTNRYISKSYTKTKDTIDRQHKHLSITNHTTVFEYAREKCHLAKILSYSGVIPRNPPAEHVLKHITVSSLVTGKGDWFKNVVKLKHDFRCATCSLGWELPGYAPSVWSKMNGLLEMIGMLLNVVHSQV